MGRFPLQEPVMRRVNLAGFTLLALGLATGLVVVSCQDQRSVTEAPRAPRADAIAGSATAVISPSGDTYLNINAVNAAGEPTLNLYTWPDNKIANAVVMKFDLASIPAGSTISSATLNLNLVESDGMTEPTYTVSAHKIVSKNPDLSRATGYTYDGVNSWTPNACCYGNIPLAQADISAPVDTKDIDKTPGFKQWDVTSIVQGWFSSPSTNFGLLLNSDPAKLRDRYRSFSSNEDPVASHRPYLTVVTGPPGTAPPPPEARLGQWSSVIPAPIVQLHVHLLRDGRVLSWGRNGDPQVWDPSTGTFTAVPSPSWLFCAGHDFLPDGRLLVAGGHITDGLGLPNTNLFDPSTGSWQTRPPTNTAEVIDLNDASPAWRYTGSMAYARRHMNATILPTGDVLVTGGTSAPGFNNFAGAVHVAELWNPTTGTWTTLASNQVNRLYHSTSLLLPDGRVLHTGSGDGASAPRELSYELYSPPYLFQGARPGITGATPATVAYGQTLVVETPDAASIAKVTFIRTGSVTHAFDQAGRLVPLAFSPVSGGVSVTLPRDHTTAPPGPDMLFLVDGNGVPSIGQIMVLR